MNVLALAGGVGGARLADGLTRTLPPDRLTIVVNTGDDFELYGLHISPDVDTVIYTLAGLANPETGWGRAGETWTAFQTLEELGARPWFRLGDRDLATHLWRTQMLHEGLSLTEATRRLCQALGVRVAVLPMSDDPVRTMVQTDEGELEFQEYFVRRGWQPVLRGVRFAGVEAARPTPQVLAALDAADLVVICPSNPYVSIDPILAVPGVRQALKGRPVEKRSRAGASLKELSGKEARDRFSVVAVSPIVGGQALKGPAAKMMRELGIEPSPVAVAQHYGDLLAGFVLDVQDADLERQVAGLGLQTLVTDTVMRTPDDRVRLARQVLDFAQRLIR